MSITARVCPPTRAGFHRDSVRRHDRQAETAQRGADPSRCRGSARSGSARRPRGSRRRWRRTRPPSPGSGCRWPPARPGRRPPRTTSRSRSGDMLSQSRKSAPASTASTASASVVTSTWTATSGNAGPDPGERRRHAARGQLVVVLDHGHVVEAHALVVAAADPDRVLLQRPQARRGLAGVQHGGLGAGQRVGPAAGVRGHPGHAAEQVERGPLGGEQGPGRAGDHGEHVAADDPGAVGDALVEGRRAARGGREDLRPRPAARPPRRRPGRPARPCRSGRPGWWPRWSRRAAGRPGPRPAPCQTTRSTSARCRARAPSQLLRSRSHCRSSARRLLGLESRPCRARSRSSRWPRHSSAAVG